jgi:hypothetical protein
MTSSARSITGTCPPAKIIRVFLLPGWLDIDLTFGHCGPRGPDSASGASPAEPAADPFRQL